MPFDATSYLAANTDLLRAGLTAQTAEQHYLAYGIRENRSTTFDSASYVAANTDLISVGLTGSAAAQHYVSYGYTESRTTTFDSASYVAANTDLISAGVTGSAAAQHYISYGYTERRSTTFDSTSYVAANTDLISAGLTGSAAAQHYVSYGYTESRSVTFNSSAYILANGLTSSGFSSSSQAAQHYISVGYSSNYSTSYDYSQIDIGEYAGAYADLSSVYTTESVRNSQLLEHYLNYGIYEGRTIPQAVPAVSQATVIADTNGSATGTISSFGERDSYRLTLIGGTEYTMTLRGSDSSSGTLSDPYLRLYDSSNRLVSFDDDGGQGLDSRIVYTPTVTGSYYLSAAAYRDAGVGSYVVSTTRPTATSVIQSSGEISRSGERDSYAVSLTAGQSYRFDLNGYDTSQGTLSDPYLRLYSYNGGLVGSMLASDDDSGQGLDSRIVYTPTTSGSYLLEAAGYGDYRTGSYTLTGSQIS